MVMNFLSCALKGADARYERYCCFSLFSLVFLFSFLVGIHALKIFHTGRNLVE